MKTKKIVRGKKNYFYLTHSYRENNSVKNFQTYLGTSAPKNIKEKKRELMQEFYKKKFFKDLDEIQKNFEKEYSKLPVSYKKKSINDFAINFTYHTQRIEGSTLTLKDTILFLEKGLTPNTRPIQDVKEAETHKQVFEEMMDYKKDLNQRVILGWHKKLLEKTKPDLAGQTRNHSVNISGSKFVPPLAIELELLLREFFGWYNKNKNNLHPVELAALTHLKFVSIHPFSDGNGRLSRLMMNFVLKKYGYPLLIIPYTKRNSYYNALEKSQINQVETIFVQWFFRRYLIEYKKYL